LTGRQHRPDSATPHPPGEHPAGAQSRAGGNCLKGSQGRQTGATPQLTGRSLTDFVVSSAHDAAQRAIEEASLLRLSADDQQRFAKALINPPKPNPALKQAKRLHLENVEVR
jgi:uncharacterized protein (DUF1778 family)